MKIRVLSDLHLEFAPWKYESAGEDVVVLAGDICDLTDEGSARRDIVLKAIKVPVITVLGNHEGYGNTLASREDIHSVHAKALAKFDNVVLLNPGVARINDVVFVGATLWTNFLMCQDPARLKAAVAHAINDFCWMKAGPGDIARTGPRQHVAITADDMLSWHVQEAAYIEKAIKDNADAKVVLVTHFMSHPLMVNPTYAGSLLNGYFGCDMSHLTKPPVVLQIAGHTHSACDTVVGATRLVCNPRGYPREKSGYDSNKVVEV